MPQPCERNQDEPEPHESAGWRAHPVYRQARRLVILIGGTSVLLVGIAMLVLPGPGTIVIPLGLSILALEFVWARRLLRRARAMAGDVGKEVGSRMFGSSASRSSDPPPDAPDRPQPPQQH